MKRINPLFALGMGLLAYGVARAGRSAANRNYLENKAVLITGGTTGLGFVLAKSMAAQGAKVAICARNPEDLRKAQDKLQSLGATAMAVRCDVSDTEEVNNCVDQVVERFGRLDILVNNAGIMQVGSVESFAREDFEKAMDIMYWGIANTTFAVMPTMREQGYGHIVNITSVGGQVALPHMLPYEVSKFAATGFSEGMAAELAKDGIHVTTILPGLMRTGSFINADFSKGAEKEFSLFSFLATAPGLTISAERAARMIIKAIKDKKSYKVLGWQARALIGINHYFPNLTAKVFGLVNRFLPRGQEGELESGKQIQNRSKDKHFGFGKIADKAREKFQDLRP